MIVIRMLDNVIDLNFYPTHRTQISAHRFRAIAIGKMNVYNYIVNTCGLEWTSQEAKNLGCDYDTWIEAQFDALSFCNGIPLPEQLFGMKAKERLMKYLYKYNISLDNNPNSQPKDSDWDQILNS